MIGICVAWGQGALRRIWTHAQRRTPWSIPHKLFPFLVSHFLTLSSHCLFYSYSYFYLPSTLRPSRVISCGDPDFTHSFTLARHRYFHALFLPNVQFRTRLVWVCVQRSVAFLSLALSVQATTTVRSRLSTRFTTKCTSPLLPLLSWARFIYVITLVVILIRFANIVRRAKWASRVLAKSSSSFTQGHAVSATRCSHFLFTF